MRCLTCLFVLCLLGGCASAPSTQESLASSAFYQGFMSNPRFAPAPSDEGIWLATRTWKVRIRPDGDGAIVEFGERSAPGADLGYRVGHLTGSAHRALWEDVGRRDVWSLPTNTSPDHVDPYHLGVTLYIQHGGKQLAHLSPRWCRVVPSEATPSVEEQARFAAFVESARHVADTVASKPQAPPPAWID